MGPGGPGGPVIVARDIAWQEDTSKSDSEMKKQLQTALENELLHSLLCWQHDISRSSIPLRLSVLSKDRIYCPVLHRTEVGLAVVESFILPLQDGICADCESSSD